MNNSEVLITFKGESKGLDKQLDNIESKMLSVSDIVKGNLISSAVKGVAGKWLVLLKVSQG